MKIGRYHSLSQGNRRATRLCHHNRIFAVIEQTIYQHILVLTSTTIAHVEIYDPRTFLFKRWSATTTAAPLSFASPRSLLRQTRVDLTFIFVSFRDDRNVSARDTHSYHGIDAIYHMYYSASRQRSCYPTCPDRACLSNISMWRRRPTTSNRQRQCKDWNCEPNHKHLHTITSRGQEEERAGLD